MANTPFFVKHGLNINNQATVSAANGQIAVGNSTANTTISQTSFASGNSTVNTTVNSTAASLSNNAIINTSGLKLGNSTVNVVINSTALAINGSVGANGKYLQTNGSVLSWADPPASGGLVLLSSYSFSSNVTSIENTTAFSNTYDDYLLLLDHFRIPSASNGDYADFSIQIGNSSSYYTNSYLGSVPSAAGLSESIVLDSDSHYFFEVVLHGVNSNTSKSITSVFTEINYITEKTQGLIFTGAQCQLQNTNPIRRIKVKLSSEENIASGSLKIYGIRKS